LASKTLEYFEEALTGSGFARMHKSYLVNVNEVVKYVKCKGGHVFLRNGKVDFSISLQKDQLIVVF